MKANPAISENVNTSSNAAYGHFQISRQEYDTKEEEKGKRWNKRKQGTFRYFKLKQQVLIVVIIVKVNIATLYYIPRYHFTEVQQLPTLLYSFVSLTVPLMKPMKFLSYLSRSQNRKMTQRKTREKTIPMNCYLFTHPGNKKSKVE